MGLGDCKTCKVYEDRIKYLEGLLDRTLALIAPKVFEEDNREPDQKPEGEGLKFGDG